MIYKSTVKEKFSIEKIHKAITCKPVDGNTAKPFQDSSSLFRETFIQK